MRKIQYHFWICAIHLSRQRNKHQTNYCIKELKVHNQLHTGIYEFIGHLESSIGLRWPNTGPEFHDKTVPRADPLASGRTVFVQCGSEWGIRPSWRSYRRKNHSGHLNKSMAYCTANAMELLQSCTKPSKFKNKLIIIPDKLMIIYSCKCWTSPSRFLILKPHLPTHPPYFCNLHKSWILKGNPSCVPNDTQQSQADVSERLSRCSLLARMVLSCCEKCITFMVGFIPVLVYGEHLTWLLMW